MSSVSTQDDYLDPQHPSHYAPRWLRDKARFPSTAAPEATPEFSWRPISSPPLHDALLEEAIIESLRRPLNPVAIPEPPAFAYEPDRRRALFGVAARFTAAIGVSAIVALFFVFMVPTTPPAHGAMTSLSALVKSIRTALSPAPQKSDSSELAVSEYRAILTSAGAGQPAATPEESDALLQKFMQWQQKPGVPPGPVSRSNQ